MSEFGATDNLTALAIDTAVADRHFTGWMHWAYKTWRDPTTADQAQGLFLDDADLASAKPAKLRTLVRTYPQATAGTPLALSFDPATGAFSYQPPALPQRLRDHRHRRRGHRHHPGHRDHPRRVTGQVRGM
jgi:Glycoside hydrolase family 5 C-terminal domain